MRMAFPLVLLVVGIAPSLAAQPTPADQVKAVEKTLKGHPLGLRGFSAASVVRFTWKADHLVLEPTAVHAFTVVKVDKVRLKDTKIVISGFANHLALGKPFSQFSDHNASFINIEVSPGTADLASLLDKLPTQLFFANEQEQAGALPEEARTPEKLKPGLCTYLEQGLRQVVPCQPGEYVPPQLVTKAHTSGRMAEGEVVVRLDVASTGAPGNLWILSGGNPDLDAGAVADIARYVFKPATFRGQPVGARISTVTSVTVN